MSTALAFAACGSCADALITDMEVSELLDALCPRCVARLRIIWGLCNSVPFVVEVPNAQQN